METIMPFLTRKPRIGALLAVTMGGPLIMSVMSATPAHAQNTVFDPSNYAQNILTAARTLQSVNQQIQQLQNKAPMSVNQGKNTVRHDNPLLDALRYKLGAIDWPMHRAKAIELWDAKIDDTLQSLLPQVFLTASHTA